MTWVRQAPQRHPSWYPYESLEEAEYEAAFEKRFQSVEGMRAYEAKYWRRTPSEKARLERENKRERVPYEFWGKLKTKERRVDNYARTLCGAAL